MYKTEKKIQDNIESDPRLCGALYIGFVKKYQNILPDLCSKKKCTGCELQSSLLKTSKLTLRGLCRHSSFDKTYTVQYSSDSMVSYVGLERTIISYNFARNIWIMRDVTNPTVTAVSEASLKSLAIGNIKWTITNDTKCSKGIEKLKLNYLNHIFYPHDCRDPEHGALSDLLCQPSVHLR